MKLFGIIVSAILTALVIVLATAWIITRIGAWEYAKEQAAGTLKNAQAYETMARRELAAENALPAETISHLAADDITS